MWVSESLPSRSSFAFVMLKPGRSLAKHLCRSVALSNPSLTHPALQALPRARGSRALKQGELKAPSASFHPSVPTDDLLERRVNQTEIGLEKREAGFNIGLIVVSACDVRRPRSDVPVATVHHEAAGKNSVHVARYKTTERRDTEEGKIFTSVAGMNFWTIACCDHAMSTKLFCCRRCCLRCGCFVSNPRVMSAPR